VTIDRVGAYAVLFGDLHWAGPRQKCLLDFVALVMRADFAVVLVSPLADREVFYLTGQPSPSWFIAFHLRPSALCHPLSATWLTGSCPLGNVRRF